MHYSFVKSLIIIIIRIFTLLTAYFQYDLAALRNNYAVQSAHSHSALWW